MTRKKTEATEPIENQEEPTKETQETKAKELLRTLKSEKMLGNARLFLASDPAVAIRTIPFGIKELDTLCRGIVCGGYTVLGGAEKSGKSSAMLRALASLQAHGKRPVLVDLEERFDPTWAKIQGVDLSNLLVLSGSSDLEDALNIVESGLRDNTFDALAIDSIASKAPRGELIDKSGKHRGLEDDTVALMARQLSKWFRRMSALVGSKKIPVIIIAQVRTTNISSGAYLDIVGGLALRHYASTVLKFSRTEKIIMTKQKEKQQLGYWLKLELKKTSLCDKEGQDVRLPFYFGVGIDDIATAVRSGLGSGLIKNLVKGVEFNDKRYHSEAHLVEKLKEDRDLYGVLVSSLATLLEGPVNAPGSLIERLDDEKAPEPHPED